MSLRAGGFAKWQREATAFPGMFAPSLMGRQCILRFQQHLGVLFGRISISIEAFENPLLLR
jgi:hypothetical protein